MTPDKPLRAGEEVALNFAFADAKTGAPVTDLKPYLGALAHFVIVSGDTNDYLHVHPLEKGGMQGEHGGHAQRAAQPQTRGDAAKNASSNSSEIGAHTTFPRAGLYKLWTQFQRGNRVIIAPFVVRVAEGEGKTAEAGK